MNKVFKYTIAMILLGSLNACEKFLDEQPRHSLTLDNAIRNAQTAKAAVGGIYATFQNDNWAGGLYLSLGTKSGFMQITNDLDYNLSYTQANASFMPLRIWRQFYTGVNAANFAIQGISALSESNAPKEEKQKLLAEARALRAWINANLLWNFGHWWAEDSDKYGILYRDEPADMTNVNKKRLTVGESYEKIYEDLDFAIANLADFSSPRFMSKQFAEVIKAKLLLYRGGYRDHKSDLDASLALINNVLTTHPATFQMESDLREVYKKAWDSNENLFVRYLEDNGSRTLAGGSWYTNDLYYKGNILPLPPNGTLTAGLRYGVDWFSADPRWDIATGPVRSPQAFQNTYSHTFKKLARLGNYAGKQAKDEKYATYFFRYPELYLMKAELLARTGASVSESIAPINEMRSKRVFPVLESLNPGSESELMDLIFKEYFKELCFENGSEFFAALRFNKEEQPWIVTIKDGKPLEENRLCWPIPDAEILNNKLMEQNPDLK